MARAGVAPRCWIVSPPSSLPAPAFPKAVQAVNLMANRKATSGKRSPIDTYIKPELKVSDDCIGQPMSPDGGGFMPLSQAAYWIATKQGTHRIGDCNAREAWEPAYRELLKHIATGEILIIGRQTAGDLPSPIEGYKFSGIAIDFPFALDTRLSLVAGKVPHLVCRLSSAEDWESGSTDELFGKNPQRPIFSHLEVRKSDVERILSGHGKDHLIARRPSKQRKRAAAKAIIKELFNGPVPDYVSNKELCYRVREKNPNLSDDTILRAAGRRK
jgi:hypothetical protein